MLLDMSEEMVMADQEQVAIAKSKLDANGWNTSGDIYPATIARVRVRTDSSELLLIQCRQCCSPACSGRMS